MSNKDENKPYRICGSGIFALNQPRYTTAKEAYDDLWRYAKSQGQSPLYFQVIKDNPDGSYELA